MNLLTDISAKPTSSKEPRRANEILSIYLGRNKTYFFKSVIRFSSGMNT